MSATEVDALADRVAIAELTARYNRAADARDGEALAAVFTPDGVFRVLDSGRERQTFRGAAELVQMIAAQPAAVTAHLTVDAIIELGAEFATQTCTVLLTRRDSGAERVSVRTGRYTDRLIRTRSGWRFTHREVDIDGENAGFLRAAAVSPH